ncbi:MAG TPA: adenylate/guanylate cyclase domain-containing protein [Gemmatimonadaceae bacterium]|jgi:adenylate cyclase|nr:adenylate/guanylate cyclase domain-containing protein [Gemmatimonadaceae bacterium]
MPFKLTSTDNTLSFELRPGPAQVVGRAPTCDFPVIDPTISRRHAEVAADDTGVAVRDLGSSNGTFINGERIDVGHAAPGDAVTFGKVEFTLTKVEARKSAPVDAPPQDDVSAPPGATIVRQLPVSGKAPPKPTAFVAALPEDKSREKLSTLLEISKGLGRAVDTDAILDKIVQYAYQVLAVDRVAILLLDDDDQLVPKISRDKRGADAPRMVPQSIARAAVTDKVAILSDNAGEDSRFGGQSVVLQQVRSAICSPLMGSEDKVLGVLYVDNVSTTHRFTDEDLDFLIAFSGIAAVAIENSQFAERIRRETLARSNFERYFTPQLAQRIASSAGATRLGGDKRPVAVLFSDIRGFTALSETMNPDDMAKLLSEYFTEMVDCVFRHEGTLDKFIGDAVMAQWGAPIGEPTDADKAVRAAMDMIRELDKLNARWKAEGRPELQIGIGLNQGDAFAGNIGSEKRLEFTVIGDTVNTASRLCGVAGPREILISQSMLGALHDKPRVEERPPMELKGKSQPVPVFRIVV